MKQKEKAELIPRFVESMQRVWNRMRSHSPPAFSDVELTITQSKAVIFLGQGPQRMGDIAATLGIGLSSATNVIDRLVSKGLVQRSQDPADRRLVLCSLTDAGQQHMDEWWKVNLTGTREAAEALDCDELRTVIQAMELLETALSRRGQRQRASSESVERWEN